ncbi:replication restart helicase PriA [Dyadobacter fanqingshengii]|uniref:Replication restart protein PriA n=1 Tax=Dyadobacter fanqingshengii TaxID=2906443 RepID=A0A9X1TAV2_9BACT|nr:primosomal protein N' [Dyadobacter fanqingshengii]MCF0042171.1 primosomal protein N' [Dyadobacter fanqingshengii]USJ35297.1 primosomal protein N' [Dyadobacter fanqingshengii]
MASLFEEETTFFADLILPVPIPSLFTYRVPREMSGMIKVGARVIVQFGQKRVITAVVANIHSNPPSKYQAKYILELLDEEPIVTTRQLELFNWVAEYYLCNIGEVLNIALPAGLKITSQSRIQMNPEFEYDDLLTDQERIVVDEIKKHQTLSYEEVERLLQRSNITALIKSLVGKRAVILFEEVKERYKPKVVRKIRLNAVYISNDALSKLAASLDKTPKQQEILLKYLSYIPVYNNPDLNQKGLDKSIFSQDDNVSDASLNTLVKKGIFEQFEIFISRFDDIPASNAVITLTETQKEASKQIHELFAEKEVVLLHGITGSGKTEVYIELIKQVLESGLQVLFLLPEIALTTQIVVRLRKVFGDTMGIYHSKFSDNERVEVWKGILDGKFQFVVGVRSAVFLPFDNLGLIIVDEEHETSYKQHDPAPRYNARDVAVIMSYMHKGKTLLGSATPSLESYYHAQTGRYGFVEMKQRFGNAALPTFELIDTKKEKKSKKMKNEFSSVLIDHLQLNLKNKEQTILFQNRRGYSPYLQCEICNWIPDCANCDVSLTYHMKAGELRCHYCGHKEEVTRTCPQCGSTQVKTMGYGTEKIEDELHSMFPEARVQRMDLDTTRAKNAYQQIISEFEEGGIDILVGTQMVSKGLDFDNVSIVGIFDADRIIHFPEFRASERAFQMLTQVSGRAGRRAEKPGKVLIQTNNPGQKLLDRIINNDYEGMYAAEIEEREKFHYPPFTRLIKVTVKHVDEATSSKAAKILAEKLTANLGASRVLGPQPPLVERVRNQFLFDILIKLEREKINFKAAKSFIQEKVIDILTDKTLKSIQVVIDVDCL